MAAAGVWGSYVTTSVAAYGQQMALDANALQLDIQQLDQAGQTQTQNDAAADAALTNALAKAGVTWTRTVAAAGTQYAKSVDAAMVSEAAGAGCRPEHLRLGGNRRRRHRGRFPGRGGADQDRAYADAQLAREKADWPVWQTLQTALVNADATAVGKAAGLYKTYLIAVDAANCTLTKAMAADAQTGANEFAAAPRGRHDRAVPGTGCNPPSPPPLPSSATTAVFPTGPRMVRPGLRRTCWTARPRTSPALPTR